MKADSAKKIVITAFDELFQTDSGREDANREKIMEIPLNELFSFEGHPFKVNNDDAMKEIAESIEKFGVLAPGLARPRKAGGYEIVSGHRRRRGCELAGRQTMPVIVRELSDDEATVIMVDSNLQREMLLFSEKAFAYKMKLDAIKRMAGRPAKENCSQVGNNLGKKSCDIIAEKSGESKNQIYRYIRLTELVQELLGMVDEKKISFNPAVELSYLKKEEQAYLLEVMDMEEATPSLSQAQRMKKFSQDGKLTPEVIAAIMSEEKKETDKVTIKGGVLKKFFPNNYTPRQMEDVILKLLENWRKKQSQPDA